MSNIQVRRLRTPIVSSPATAEELIKNAVVASLPSMLDRHLFAVINNSGIITYISSAQVNLLGYEDGELNGVPVFSLLHPDDRDHVVSGYELMLQGVLSPIAPHRIRKKDGSYLWLQSAATNLLSSPSVKGILIQSTDVTAVVSSKEELEASQQNYKYLFENNPAPMFIWEFDTRKIIDCNQEALHLYGYTRTEFLSLTLFDIRPVEDIPQILEATRSEAVYANRTYVTHKRIWRHLRKDGTILLLEITGHLLNYKGKKSSLVILRDVTQQKREEQKRKLLESVVTNSTDAIVITEAEPFDEPGPRILYANEAFANLTGYDIEEVIGKTPRFLQGPNTNRQVLATFGEAIRNWHPAQMTVVNYTKEGNPFWVHISVTPVADETGKFTHWVSIHRNVTDEKLEEERNAFKAELTQYFSKDIRLKDCVRLVLENLLNRANCDQAEYWWLNEEREQLELVDTVYTDRSVVKFLPGPARAINCDVGLPGKVWQEGDIVVWSGSHCLGEVSKRFSMEEDMVESVIGIPLFHNEKPVGMLVLGATKVLFELGQTADLFCSVKKILGAEFKRKKLEEEMHQMFVTAQDIMGIGGLDGFIRKINPAACSLLGYDEQELLDIPFLELIHEQDREATYAALASLTITNATITHENRLFTKKGEMKWFNWSFTLSGEDGMLFAVAKDITEQRALRELLTNASVLAEMGAWEYSSLTRTVRVSDGVGAILGLSNTKILDTALLAEYIVDGPAACAVFGRVKEAIAQQLKFDEEIQLKDQHGQRKWVRVIGEQEKSGVDHLRIVGSVQDISRRKAYEHSLQELNNSLHDKARELAASNKELEQFAYIASHDLQEPLRMVTSFLSQIEKRYNDQLDERGRQYIQFAVDGAMRMRQIILDLLDYSRIGRSKDQMEIVSLKGVMNELLQHYQATIEEKKAIIIVGELPLIKWFRTPVFQLLQNLLNNALKYCKDGVVPHVSIQATTLDHTVEVSITDNGIGIDPSYYERIFTIFQRLHPTHKYGGTGMGLAIVKKVVEAMHGAVRVESVLGVGSKFIVTIPKALVYGETDS